MNTPERKKGSPSSLLVWKKKKKLEHEKDILLGIIKGF